MQGLTKNDNNEIGFVLTSLFKHAITLDELKEWCYLVIRDNDDYPTYIFDIIDFEGAIAHLPNVIGFSPSWCYPEDAKKALYGIAYIRNIDIYDCPINKKTALEKLIEYPQIKNHFIRA